MSESFASRNCAPSPMAFPPVVQYSTTMSTIMDSLDARLAGTLKRLRESRGWSLAELAEKSRVARAKDNPVWTDPATGFRRRVLSPLTLAGQLELIEGELPPGAAISYPA